MQTSRQFLGVGVSAVILLAGVSSGTAQSVSQTTPSPTRPTQSTPLPPNVQPSDRTPRNQAPSEPTPQETPIPTPTQTSTPVPAFPDRNKPAPNYLNPSGNPLQFPTKPDEVRIQGTQPITLKQALELAERNSRTLELSRLQLERSRAQLREAQAAEYPTVSIQSNVSRSESAGSELGARQQEDAQRNLPANLRQQVTGDNVSNALSGTAQLSYDIYTSGQRPALIRAAEQQVRSDQLAVEATLEQLRLNVTNAYYDVQESDESVRINQAAVVSAQQSLRDTLAQERAGIGTRFDVLQAQVQLANSQQDLVNARAQQQIRRRELARQLSLSQVVEIVAADPVDVAGSWNLPLEDSIVQAFKNRAELEQQLALRELSRQRRRAQLSALGPKVSLSAQYNLLNQLNGVGFADGYSFGANLNWLLFDGGAARARAEQEERGIEIAETRFADTRNQVRFDVEQAYANLLSNRENIQTATTALNQAREALRLARLRFQAGVGTQTDVINAETNLTRSEGSRVTAILGYNRALAAMRRAVSNIPIDITPDITSDITPGSGTVPAPVERPTSSPLVPSSPQTTPTPTPQSLPQTSAPRAVPSLVTQQNATPAKPAEVPAKTTVPAKTVGPAQTTSTETRSPNP